MKVSMLKDHTGAMVDLNSFIKLHSFEWDDKHSVDALLEAVGDARYVLLGEASHGTHEYYSWRARISRELISRLGFSFIAVEGDWPDCYLLNRYIKSYPDAGTTAREVLEGFSRWPTWMWANWEIVALAEWMKLFNQSQQAGKTVGFYGLDVYSLWDSLTMMVNYLRKTDPPAYKKALKALQCFEPFGQDEGQSYARATLDEWLPASCEDEVLDLLMTVEDRLQHYNADPEAMLNVGVNSNITVNAEKYYRAMVRGGPESWNIRDRHMYSTLNRLMNFHGPAAKVIIWEHNTHIGDARATDMRLDGMINLGQLLNEGNFREGVFSIGFGSYQGTVIAGRRWGDVMREMKLPPAQADSWEFILHQANAANRLILFDAEWKNLLAMKELGHRAVGVVYNPQWEYGNYVPSILPLRYDAFVFIDQTKALHPLHLKPDGHKIPETYPFGI